MGSLSMRSVSLLLGLSVLSSSAHADDQLEPISYNNPGLVVDLGVGLWAWPLPMDYNGDGDLDLVVSCPDKPYNGVYYFENPGAAESGERRAECGKSGDAGVDQPSTIDHLPIFKPARRLGPAVGNIQVSYVNGDIRLLAPGAEYRNFREQTWDEKVRLPVHPKLNTPFKRTRANQWKSVDYDGDGDQDLIVGLGVWDDYGWDDAWDDNGNWTNGPLHGYVYLVENVTQAPGSKGSPHISNVRQSDTHTYADPVQLTTSDGKAIDVYGMPSPNLADFDGDGDLDLLCGEFLDGFTYFENTGTREKPQYASGTRAQDADGHDVKMDLQMITPVAIDWDGDGDVDIICGDEDGRVALIENVGPTSKPVREQQAKSRTDLEVRPTKDVPVFEQPVYFQQQAADVKFGAIVTPVSVDWDGDGDEDLICGNTAGYIGFIENLGGGATPRWAAPRRLRQIVFQSGGTIYGPLRYEAGPQGSIQGPCEAKWGYTSPVVADWNHDDRLDIVTNGIWGKVTWHARTPDLQLAPPQEVAMVSGTAITKPQWTWWTPEGNELVTQWRTTPLVIDWNDDGLNDLVMLDHEGYLAFYERSRRAAGVSRRAGDVSPQIEAGQSKPSHPDHQAINPGVDTPGSPEELVLLPPQRIFKIAGPCEFDSRQRPVGDKQDGLLRLNANRAGASGRRKLCFADWDGDGRVDLLVNSVNVNWLRNVRTDQEGFTWFEDMGQLDDRVLAGHTTSPTVVDWDKNGIPDLLVGAEDGRLYYKENPRANLAATHPGSAAASADKTQTVGTLAKPQAKGIVTEEFLYDEAPFPSCHASTIEQTPQGLVAAFFGGTDEGEKDVGIWVVRHDGERWTAPVEVANGIQHEDLRHPCWNPVLYQSPGQGPLLLFYKCGPNPREWWGMLTTSRDGGQTWSVPFRLPEGIDGPVKNKPVLLGNSTLLCGSSTEYDGWRIHFEITRDSLNWKRVGPINDATKFNAIQPTILVHKDGTLQALCRTKESVVVSTRSSDFGLTWSPLEATSLPNPNAGFDGVTLEDGRHLLVYNHTTRQSTPRGRAMINVALSEDGETWQAALVLENEAGAEFSYPAVIQTDDGLVHITYTWQRKKVKHVVIDPAKLELTPIVDGRWPGLAAE